MGSLSEFRVKLEEKTIEGKDILLFANALQELATENEDIAELLADMAEEEENFRLNFILSDTKRQASVLIENGTLVASKNLLSDPTLVIEMEETTGIQILQGQLGIMQAYQQGKINAEGNLAKAAALGMLLNLAGDELGVL